MDQSILDNRQYEQIQANAGAAIYEKVISSEWDYRYDFLTTDSWARRFNEPFLDFGCGVGMASRVFERLGKQVVAFDASRGMLRFARKRCHVPMVLADGLNLPFANKVFSTTCITGVLHHILDLDKVIAEIARCTKEVICINEPCPNTPGIAVKLILAVVNRILFIREKVKQLAGIHSSIKGSYQSKYERPIDPKILINLCNKHEFELVQIRYFSHIPLLHEFLGENIRRRLFAALISSKKGTDSEIIVMSSRSGEGS